MSGTLSDGVPDAFSDPEDTPFCWQRAWAQGGVAAAGMLGRTAEPVDFESVDGKPVDIVVLTVGPRNMAGEHIQALARVSRFLSSDSFRRQFRAAQGSDDLYRLVRQQEQAAQAAPVEH